MTNIFRTSCCTLAAFLMLAFMAIASRAQQSAEEKDPVLRQKTTKPASSAEAPRPAAPKPLLLTREQVERLSDAEKTRQLARAQLQAAQNLLDKIDAQIDGLIKDFQIELRLDPVTHERDLRVIDQQRNAFGFFPKTEPKGTEPTQPQPKSK